MNIKFINKQSWARTKPTTEGISFILLSLIIGFSAFNTGNNLLYLIFGLTLSLVGISGIIAVINISKIDINLDSHSDLFALTPSHIWLNITNNKKYFSSYAITLYIQGNSYFIDKITPESKVKIKVRSLFKTRGKNKIPEITISSNYPFGFFTKSIVVHAENKQLLVYPKIYMIKDKSDANSENIGENKPQHKGHGPDLRSLRTYNQGDNIKDIHWKLSAKMNRLYTKEYYKESNKTVKLEFLPEKESKVNLEKYISKMASLFYNLVKDGYDVEFITNYKTFFVNDSKYGYKNVLRFLALYGN